MEQIYREAPELPCTCDQLVPNPCTACWLQRSGPCPQPGAHHCKRHDFVACNGCGRLVHSIRNVSSGDGVCKHTSKDGPLTIRSLPSNSMRKEKEDTTFWWVFLTLSFIAMLVCGVLVLKHMK